MEKKRIELENEILKHKALYYQGRPEIPDHVYDRLEDDLRAIDPNNPVLSIVGSKVSSEDKVKHDKKMLSLNKTYSIDELLKWAGNHELVSTFKVDGISCSLLYKDGKLTLAKTRGDGVYGENITRKALWVKSIPKSIDYMDCEIRGELYCNEENFFHLSEEMESLGLERPSSQRNIVAGLIGRKDKVELCRYLDFYAFEVIADDERLKTEWSKIEKLQDLSFLIPKVDHHKNKKSVVEAIRETENFMSEGDYLIDGLVFSYNDLDTHSNLGETAHHPRYKMAFKFAGESKVTIIEEIAWQVSRNGYLTPVAHVKPIELSGALISRVTLHNYGMVKQYNLKKGDEIEIIRSGEVIPKFLSVKRASDNPFEIPTKCPSCLSGVVIDDIRLLCPNSECPGKKKESILNFIKKIGIDDLSSKRLDEMINKGLVKSIPDLYDITVDKLLTLEKTKEKLAEKLYSSIQKSKDVDLTTLLSALGISGGAYNKCDKVVSHGFDTIDKLKSMTVESLSEVESFAEKSATDFIQSLNEKWEIVDELLTKGFNFSHNQVSGSKIANKKFVITGSLSRKRSDIEKDIRAAGGSVSGSVSKATDYLVTNDKDSNSSKAKKARELEIPILSEDELYTFLS